MAKKLSSGVIGLGIIGSRVAANLRNAGYDVFVWNRSPRTEPNFLASPVEVAETADIIQLFVADGTALLETVAAMEPALTPRHVILNHATIAPSEAREAADVVARASAAFLDAPFTGSRDAAEAGELVYYVGGERDVVEKVRSLLMVSGRAILQVGDIGQASLIKIATNMLTSATVEVLSEALALLDKNGVSLNHFVDALNLNAVKSGTAEMKLACMLAQDFEPRFSLKHMFKDTQLALRVAQDGALELPVCTATAGSLMAGIHKGWGDLDCSALAKHYEFAGKQPVDARASNDGTLFVREEETGAGSRKRRGFFFFGGKK